MEQLPLLVAVLAVMIAANWAQQLYYLRTVNRVATEERRPGSLLVSGRSPGRLRGAVALLVVRQADDTIERALVMQGTTVFARFRERPDLTGPTAAAAAGAGSKAARAAVTAAVDRYRDMVESKAEPPATATDAGDGDRDGAVGGSTGDVGQPPRRPSPAPRRQRSGSRRGDSRKPPRPGPQAAGPS